MGAPSLAIIADEGRTGIAYYKNGEVMYAYPLTPRLGWPSNFGPGADTWRSICIFPCNGTRNLGRVVKLAMGKASSEQGILFTSNSVSIPLTLSHADYVGSNGNCGQDLALGGFSDYRWQCDELIVYNHLYPDENPSFSIVIDPQGYPVISYDYRSFNNGNNDLYLIYPIGRTGNTGTGWITQKIDSAHLQVADTGAQASLALNTKGLGFISYLQEEAAQLADLKIAFQLYRASLPIVSKP
jgi:hypothetical protein